MAITTANFNLISVVSRNYPNGFDSLSMLELGNIEVKIDSLKKPTAKQYFSSLGIKHLSFDINGNDGAIALDLNLPVACDLYHGKFDIVTNFGTSEHIQNQFQVFATIHDCCKIGGVMVHSIPLVGYWKKHCPYHYTKNFPEQLCSLNKYALTFFEIVARGKEKLIDFVAIKKENVEFALPQKEITVTTAYDRNRDNLF